MATEVVNTIRSSGGDYSSLSAWEAGEQADIVTADEYHIGEVYNDWASGLDDTVTISGWTTDATRYIEIRPASGNRHDGTDPTSGFYLKQSGTATGHFHINQNYCTVRGCAVVVDAAYAGERIPFIITSGGPGRIFDGCIGTDPNSLNNSYTFTAKYAGSGSYDHTHNIFRNCLSYDNAAGFWANIKATCENCTAIGAGSGTGFNEDNTSSRSMIAKNCVAYNFGTNFNISGVTGCTNNAASDGSTTTPPGASPYTSDVVSGDFADAANDDYHLSSGSGLIGQGANLYSDFTTDIDGDTRPSSGAWDIGADHYAAGGGAVDLGAASAKHSQKSDAAALSDAKIQLGAASAKHQHASDIAPLGTPKVQLGAASAKHAHIADAAAANVALALPAADAKHAHTSDVVALSDAKQSLPAADAKHAHSADSASLTLTDTLAAASAKHSHTSDTASLSAPKIQLGAAGAKHTHKADAAAIVVGNVLPAASAKHAHRADAAALSNAKIQLGAASAKHQHKSDASTFIVGSVLPAASAKHAHKADTAPLSTPKSQLGAASAKHTHKANASTFVVGFILAAAAAKHIHKSDVATIGRVKIDLTALSAKHAHKADSAAVLLGQQLDAQSARHGHTADAASITVEQITIGAASAKHAHKADDAILTGIRQTMLAASAKHAHTAEFVRYWSSAPALTPAANRVYTMDVDLRVYSPLSADRSLPPDL